MMNLSSFLKCKKTIYIYIYFYSTFFPYYVYRIHASHRSNRSRRQTRYGHHLPDPRGQRRVLRFETDPHAQSNIHLPGWIDEPPWGPEQAGSAGVWACAKEKEGWNAVYHIEGNEGKLFKMRGHCSKWGNTVPNEGKLFQMRGHCSKWGDTVQNEGILFKIV